MVVGGPENAMNTTLSNQSTSGSSSSVKPTIKKNVNIVKMHSQNNLPLMGSPFKKKLLKSNITKLKNQIKAERVKIYKVPMDVKHVKRYLSSTSKSLKSSTHGKSQNRISVNSHKTNSDNFLNRTFNEYKDIHSIKQLHEILSFETLIYRYRNKLNATNKERDFIENVIYIKDELKKYGIDNLENIITTYIFSFTSNKNKLINQTLGVLLRHVKHEISKYDNFKDIYDVINNFKDIINKIDIKIRYDKKRKEDIESIFIDAISRIDGKKNLEQRIFSGDIKYLRFIIDIDTLKNFKRNELFNNLISHVFKIINKYKNTASKIYESRGSNEFIKQLKIHGIIGKSEYNNIIKTKHNSDEETNRMVKNIQKGALNSVYGFMLYSTDKIKQIEKLINRFPLKKEYITKILKHIDSQFPKLANRDLLRANTVNKVIDLQKAIREIRNSRTNFSVVADKYLDELKIKQKEIKDQENKKLLNAFKNRVSMGSKISQKEVNNITNKTLKLRIQSIKNSGDNKEKKKKEELQLKKDTSLFNALKNKITSNGLVSQNEMNDIKNRALKIKLQTLKNVSAIKEKKKYFDKEKSIINEQVQYFKNTGSFRTPEYIEKRKNIKISKELKNELNSKSNQILREFISEYKSARTRFLRGYVLYIKQLIRTGEANKNYAKEYRNATKQMSSKYGSPFLRKYTREAAKSMSKTEQSYRKQIRKLVQLLKKKYKR